LIWNTNTQTKISWHNGETGGYHALVMFNPEAKQGVVLLANVGDMSLDNLGLHALVQAFAVPAPSSTR
jgi:hypothetical protein